MSKPSYASKDAPQHAIVLHPKRDETLYHDFACLRYFSVYFVLW